MIAITDKPIVLDELLKAVDDPGAGAISTFSGTVRNHNLGRQVLFLEYECYEPMALKEMARIEAEIKEKWPALKVAIVHRVGRMEIGEASVVIAVSTAHRHDSLDAVTYAIDTLKKTVPVWKKEYWADGSMWLENCCAH